MATYTINIELSSQTINALAQGGFTLYALKAVKTMARGGAPLLWYGARGFTSVTQVVWEDQYAAFVSTSQIIANGVVVAKASVDIDLGQTAEVAQTGRMTLSGDGAAGAVSILNQGDREWTTGLFQSIAGEPSLVCAVPLYGQNLDVIAPVERVLLMFSTNTANTGTVMSRAWSPGLLVDLSAQNTGTVQFDVNTGWNPLGASARQVAANQDLVPLLIQN
jgi:hypothetical protein